MAIATQAKVALLTAVQRLREWWGKRGERGITDLRHTAQREASQTRKRNLALLWAIVFTFAIVSFLLFLPFAIWFGAGILPRYDITQAMKSFGLLLCIVLPLFVSASWAYVFILRRKEGES